MPDKNGGRRSFGEMSRHLQMRKTDDKSGTRPRNQVGSTVNWHRRILISGTYTLNPDFRATGDAARMSAIVYFGGGAGSGALRLDPASKPWRLHGQAQQLNSGGNAAPTTSYGDQPILEKRVAGDRIASIMPPSSSGTARRTYSAQGHESSLGQLQRFV